MIPNYHGTLLLSATATSQSANLPLGGGDLLWLSNTGAGTAFVEVGQAGVVATIPAANVSGGFPILANMPPTPVRLRPTDTDIAYIATANLSLYPTRGHSS